MSQNVEVPVPVLKGVRSPTEEERAIIPDHLLPERYRRQSNPAKSQEEEQATISTANLKQCNSCLQTSETYTQKCVGCDLFICMGDDCCNVADSRVFEGGSSSTGGRYICNSCDKKQKAKLARLKNTPDAKTMQQTFKPPLIKKKKPNLVPAHHEISPEDVPSDDTAPDPDYSSRIWLEEVRAAMVNYFN